MAEAKTVHSAVHDYGLLIGGEWRQPAATLTLENPATEEPLCRIGDATADEVHAAVEAARAALPGWSRRSASARARLVSRLAELVEANKEQLAEAETLDVGKPISDSRSIDTTTAVDALDHFAGLASKVEGRTIPVPGRFLNYTVHEPYGVVAGIIPWNFPLLQAIWKIAPAVLAGNTIVLKPAEQASVTPLRLGELCVEAGFPPGVVNVVTGCGETAGQTLVDHPHIAAIAFTGSTETGSLIAGAAARRLVPVVALELGGKSPNLVFEDVDPRLAGTIAYNAIFANAGQVCTAASRLLLQRPVHDAVLERVLELVRTRAVVGDPLEEQTTIGPLISREQWQRVDRYVRLGREEGAALLCGGGRPERPERGHYYAPTIFAGARNDMAIAREEIFGPVLTVIPFDTEEEAVALANDSRYGLAAGVQTRDAGRAVRVAGQLQAGNLWVNTWGNVHSSSPYGGYKESGYGREMGFDVMQAYAQVKSVWLSTR